MLDEYRYPIYFLMAICALFLIAVADIATTNQKYKSLTPIIKSSSIAFSTQQSYYRSIVPEEKMQIHPSLPSSSLLDLTRN